MPAIVTQQSKLSSVLRKQKLSNIEKIFDFSQINLPGLTNICYVNEFLKFCICNSKNNKFIVDHQIFIMVFFPPLDSHFQKNSRRETRRNWMWVFVSLCHSHIRTFPQKWYFAPVYEIWCHVTFGKNTLENWLIKMYFDLTWALFSIYVPSETTTLPILQ